jgi:hypothetical protein
MEHTKLEATILEETINDAAELQIRELSDLQLVLVGGGSGEVTPY